MDPDPELLSEWARMTRRGFLSAATIAALAGCTGFRTTRSKALPVAGSFSELDATGAGGIDLFLERRPLQIGGGIGNAITINGSVPGPVIRMTEGKEAVIRVHNRMGESTSIHWHGILLPFTMDGVPGISYAGIPAGETFIYRFRVRQNGTYWYHSHSGLQEQLGLYGQLIVQPAGHDPVTADVEHTVVLSDWTFEDPHAVMRKLKTMDGYFNFQRPTLANLSQEMNIRGMDLGGVLASRTAWNRMRMDESDILDVTGATYKYLINGRTADENPSLLVKPGQRVRLRMVNASAMTYYDVRLPGLPMTVVQADGQNVRPVEVDELRIAVAETYDVLVTMPPDRAVTLFAETMDRSGYARATLALTSAVAAEVPERRPRPLLTMADMGMVHGAGGHAGMAGMGDHASQVGMAGMADKADQMGMDHAAAGAGDNGPTAGHAHAAQGPTLAVIGLPDRRQHGPADHGPGSITMGHSTAYRQLDDPGLGLGADGRRVLTYGHLRCLKTPDDRRAPTREINLHLTGNMHQYIWGFDGKKWSEADMLRFGYGERLRINFINDTMMNHPLHLHGMWMDLYAGHAYGENPRKHTVNVQPAELVTVDISADAPGQWAFHCHLLYHMEMGMFRTVAVVRSVSEEVTNANH